MGTCATCGCSAVSVNLSINPVGSYPLPTSETCSEDINYASYGFSTNFLGYNFSSQGLNYTLVFIIPNVVEPNEVTAKFLLNVQGVLDIISIKHTNGDLKISTGTDSGQFYFKIQNIDPNSRIELRFCFVINTTDAGEFVLETCVATTAMGRIK